MTLSHPKTVALVCLALSIATIAGAWAFQLIGGLPPCPLCLQQRWPYYIAIPLMAAAFWLARSNPWSFPVRALLAFGAIVMLVGAILGGYHTGVEWGWFEGPTGCSGGETLTPGTKLNESADIQVIRCDEAPWHLFGLSLAGYNTLISAALSLLAMAGFLKSKPES